LGGAAAAALLLACGHAATPRGITPNTEGWWRELVFYEVFVRSFADSDGDGIGDLPGLTARLDYLNDGDPLTDTDLGLDAIWLMPIHPSPSYHGYDVKDYRAINPQYGTLADFDALVAAAHQRGIRVVIDMVLNHSSSQHPWFLDARTGTAAAKRDWYVWSATDPGWVNAMGRGWNLDNGAWYYAAFGGGMPDLNLRNAAVVGELVDTMRFWLARGVDGFRLDAVRYYVENGGGSFSQDQPETHALLAQVRAALQADYPDALLVAEAWASQGITSTYYGNGDEAQLAFCFDLADGIKGSAQLGSASWVVTTLQQAVASLAGKDLGFMAPFLSNHDQTRVRLALGADAPARVAAATLAALPGTPFVYYGEELGMQGGTGGDPQKRTPMRWTATGPTYGFTSAAATWCDLDVSCAGTTEAAGVDAATERGDTASLWHLYRRLIALRHQHPMLANGDVVLPSVVGGGAGLFALLRPTATRDVLFVANYAGADSGSFTVAAPGTPVLIDGEGLSGSPVASSGAVTFDNLAPKGFAFVSME
jgi:glycosidase